MNFDIIFSEGSFAAVSELKASLYEQRLGDVHGYV